MARPLPKREDANGRRIGFLMLPVDVANRRNVSSTAKIVWAWLRSREPREGSGGATASIREIARGVGVNFKTAWRATMALRKCGLLRVEAAGCLAKSGLRGKPAVWTTLIPGTSVGISTTLPDKAEHGRNGNACVGKMPTEHGRNGNACVGKMPTEQIEREGPEKGKGKKAPPSFSLPKGKTANGAAADPTNPEGTLDLGAALRFSLGRAPSAKERGAFLQAVGEAREGGATDALIGHFVRRTPPSEAVWTGPNAARDEARRLVKSWAKAGVEPRRASVGAILADARSAWEYVQQKDLPAWDLGKARNEKVLLWAAREAAALQAADPSAQLPPAAEPAPAALADDPDACLLAAAMLEA